MIIIAAVAIMMLLAPYFGFLIQREDRPDSVGGDYPFSPLRTVAPRQAADKEMRPGFFREPVRGKTTPAGDQLGEIEELLK